MILALLQQPIPFPSPSSAPGFGAGIVTFSFLLSFEIWWPVLIAAVIALVPNPRGRYDSNLRLAAFWANAFPLAVTLIAYTLFRTFVGGLQFEEKLSWIPSLGILYHLGTDGIGMTMLILSNLVGVAAVLASSGVRTRVREYFALLLLVQGAVHGVIAAQNLFVLVLFWGAAVVPLALLVLGWSDRRATSAAWRVLGYGALSTAAVAAAALMLFRATGSATFEFDSVLKATVNSRVQVAVGIAVLIAAATRLPIVPLHGWVRTVVAEAPVGVVVILMGASARLGAYLVLRVLVGAEKDAAVLLAPFIGVLAAVTVGYAALAALRTNDIRRVGAYLAMVPGGVTMLGIAGLTPMSLDGAVMMVFAGGMASALVAGVTATVAERSQTRNLNLMGGLALRLPTIGWLFLLATLALISVPGFGTFLGELMTFYGSFKTNPVGAFGVAIGMVAVFIAVAVIVQRVLFSRPNPDAPGVTRQTLAESWYLGLLVGSLLWVGLVPNGPKLAGVPIFDPGLINVISASTTDLAAPYVPPVVPGQP